MDKPMPTMNDMESTGLHDETKPFIHPSSIITIAPLDRFPIKK